MKTIISRLCLFFITIQPVIADIPSSFDPRSEDQRAIQGCGFIIHPKPLTGSYLIITRPNKDNPKDTFFTFEAIADPSLKLDDVVGKFVMIKAIRTKTHTKGEPSLRITFVTPIMAWD